MGKKQTSVSHSSTESEIISLNAGLRIDGLPALDPWDIVIEVSRSTDNTARHGQLAQGDFGGTREHSIIRKTKQNKTNTSTKTKKKRLSNSQKRITYPPAHILLKVSLSCTLLMITKLSSR